MIKQVRELSLNLNYEVDADKIHGGIHYTIYSTEDPTLQKQNSIELDESNAKVKALKDFILNAIKTKEGIV